jgi:hypothetical protein
MRRRDERIEAPPAVTVTSTTGLFPPVPFSTDEQHPLADGATMPIGNLREAWRRRWDLQEGVAPGELLMGTRVSVPLVRGRPPYRGTLGAYNTVHERQVIHYDTGQTLWFDPEGSFQLVDQVGMALGTRVAILPKDGGTAEAEGVVVGHNANCCYLVDFHDGQDPVLMDPTITAFRVMDAKAGPPISRPDLEIGDWAPPLGVRGRATLRGRRRPPPARPVGKKGRRIRPRPTDEEEDFGSETDDEIVLTQTCPKCQRRFHPDLIGPHFRECIPKWGKKAAGRIHVGSRVEVKFLEESTAGFNWYAGTVTGRVGTRYSVHFDDDDGFLWEIDAGSSCYRLLDDGIKRWSERVGRLVPGTRLEVEFDDLHESTWEIGTVVGVNSDGTYTINYEGALDDGPMILDLLEGYARILDFDHTAQPAPASRRASKRPVIQNFPGADVSPEWPLTSRHHFYSFLYWDPHAFTWDEVRAFRQTLPLRGIELRRILKKGHPARGGIGAFATRDIAAKRFLCVYTGLVTLCCEDSDSQFITKLGASTLLDVDASKCGNEARFINDFRNIARSSNVMMKSASHPLTGESAPSVFTERAIAKGDELLLDYGQQYWDSLRDTSQPTAEAPRGREAFPPCAWPPELEYVSGYPVDACVTLAQLRGAHTFRRLNGAHVIKQADGRPSLVAAEALPKGHLLGVYSGRVGKQPAGDRSLPIGRGCYVVECGNEAKYLRHAFGTGNVFAECRNDNLIGHLYVALLTSEPVAPGVELVLDRALPIAHIGPDALPRTR